MQPTCTTSCQLSHGILILAAGNVPCGGGQQVGVQNVSADLMKAALAADAISFGSPSAVK
jgi:hypothetical protein